MTCVAQIRMRARAAQCAGLWGSGERLVDSRYYLLGLELVETGAAAVDVAFAAFEGARHARQGILHHPNIALVLDGAARGPWCRKSANRPRSPDARIHRPEQSDRRASGCGGKMRRRRVGSDIDSSVGQEFHRLRPLQLMEFAGAPPDLFEI